MLTSKNKIIPRSHNRKKYKLQRCCLRLRQTVKPDYNEINSIVNSKVSFRSVFKITHVKQQS